MSSNRSALPAETSVYIAAAGHGTRLRGAMTDANIEQSYPKHLLPTGNGEETLLGRIVRQSLEAPVLGAPVIYANEENRWAIAGHPDVDRRAHVVVSPHEHSFSPFVDSLRQTRQRILGSAGDFYADFDWADVLDHHESGDYPVTFVAARSVAVEKGAVFDIDDSGEIIAFRRSPRTEESDFINIGVYVFDPEKSVLRIVSEIEAARGLPSKEEALVEELIAKRLLGAYVIEGAFNINTVETYDALLRHTMGTSSLEAEAASPHQRVVDRLGSVALLPALAAGL